jgi:tetratricopeptide (TPR) repeat protein
MKKVIILSLFCLVFIGCNSAGTSNVPANPESEIVSAHSEEALKTPVPPTSAKSKWTQSGDPIDVSAFNAEIEKAEKNLKAKPNDEATKNAASDAYFKRGFALTEARQYASALGDYRRAVKLNPNNADAQEWIKKIVAIYNGLNKSYPNEGEEPPPLPFGKDAEKSS